MGWDLIAHFPVIQKQINEFINSNNCDDEEKIARYYVETCLEEEDNSMDVYYYWNDDSNQHEIYSAYRVNFICNDERLCDDRFLEQLAEKVGRDFPRCLRSICWEVRTPKDAIEVAQELQVFFPDDEEIMWFANWLLKVSKYCTHFDLSW